MKARRFSQLLAAAVSRAERDQLPELERGYRDALQRVAVEATTAFRGITASAAWQPPPDGAILTPLALQKLAARLNRDLESVWTTVVLDVPGGALARAGIAWDVAHPLTQALLASAAQRTGAALGDAVQPVLRKAVGDAYTQGLSVRDAAANIRTAITDASVWQAEMLARTDLNSLANGASQAAARLVGVPYKTWDATLDSRTRETHADAHGQTVPLAATFNVGGEALDYPGDPAGSDAETINCRCTLLYADTLSEGQALLADGGGNIMDAMASKKHGRQVVSKRRRAATPRRTLVAAAIPVKSTPVVDTPWDGNEAMGRATTAAEYRSISAWVDSSGDPDQRQSYKFPHHSTPGGPANINGVRNALARLPQASIPSSDVAGVRAHLQRHLDDFNKRRQSAAIAQQVDVAETGDEEAPIRWTGVLTLEGLATSDGRYFAADAWTWREPPLDLLAQLATAEGHDGAELVGKIERLWKEPRPDLGEGVVAVMGEGYFSNREIGQEVASLVDDEMLRRISVDYGVTELALRDPNSGEIFSKDEIDDIGRVFSGDLQIAAIKAEIGAATLVSFSAFADAMIAVTAAGSLVVDEPFTLEIRPALTAAAAPAKPPRAWFETAEPPGKMPLTITDEGRVFGHLADWDSCHMAFLPACVPPPKSTSGYAYFHAGEIETAEGDRLAVGKLMVGGRHDNNLSHSREEAMRHYDDLSRVGAVLRATDGQYGIWVCGALHHSVTDSQVADMKLNPPSGDWRVVDGQHELICGLSVPVPGYPIPRAELQLVASGGELQMGALVASLAPTHADSAALASLEHAGVLSSEQAHALDEEGAGLRIRVLAARAEGIEALAAMAEA